MKLVKEHINEKFKEDSDPIEDMGIGLYPKMKKFIKEVDDYLNPEYHSHNVFTCFEDDSPFFGVISFEEITQNVSYFIEYMKEQNIQIDEIRFSRIRDY